MKLSIVTTLYKSAPYIEEFHRRATEAAQQLVGEDYEIVMVNDGSPDDSLKIASQIARIDYRLKILGLSRNFGHHKAMMAGLEHAGGSLIFMLDVDLEEEPELLLDFHRAMVDGQADSVFGIREERTGTWFERWGGDLFYKIFNLLSSQKIPTNKLMATLMTEQFRDALLSHKEQNIFLAGILAASGFLQIPVVCKKTNKGATTYCISRKVRQGLDGITSFSAHPLHYLFYSGVAFFIFAILFILYIALNKLLSPDIPLGWTALMATILFCSSVIMLGMSIIGIYIEKLFDEIKRRPRVIVSQKINF